MHRFREFAWKRVQTDLSLWISRTMHRPMLPLRLLLVTDVHMLKQLRMTNTAPFLDEHGTTPCNSTCSVYLDNRFNTSRTVRSDDIARIAAYFWSHLHFDSIVLSFIELCRCHFLPRSSSVFHATWIFQHPRTSHGFPRKTSRYNFYVDQRV